MSNKSNYGENSIMSFKDEEQVRQRPQVIFGTNDAEGCFRGICEIISNSLDEAREGYGDTIIIKLHSDGSISVRDFGRGVPMGWNERENKYNWELVFCTLYSTGKSNDSGYKQALGLNGLGATAMQYASEFMNVESIYGGNKYTIHFEKGRKVGEMSVEKCDENSGTFIHFKPDDDVFTDTRGAALSFSAYRQLLTCQAMLHKKLALKLISEIDNKEETYYFENGIVDFIDESCEKRICDRTRVYEQEVSVKNSKFDEEYPMNMRVAFNFSRADNAVIAFHNGSLLSDGGVTYDSAIRGVISAFTKCLIDSGKMSKGEKLSWADIESLIFMVLDTNYSGFRTYFKNQTKTAVTNEEFRPLVWQFVNDRVIHWILDDKAASERVMNEILINKKAREEADKVSKAVQKELSKGITGIGNQPKKFVDCKSKDVTKRELYIVEGDSALGACKLARDSTFQAIIPVRGKILNCLKENLAKILTNTIIIDITRIFGCGIEAKSEYINNLPEFDIQKLNWDKIIICTDADVDGKQIRCLILAMLYRLYPTLIRANKVFIAETPLYEITYKDKRELKTCFAYDDDEKDEIVGGLIDRKYTGINIQRSKGLGENEPDMMNVSTMNPKTRKLTPITWESSDKAVAEMFNTLLGEDLESRKSIVDEYFSKVGRGEVLTI